MRRISFLAALMAIAAVSPNHAQNSGPANSGGAVPPGYQVYTNAELHLTLTYSAELTGVDGAFATTAARRMIYGDEQLDAAREDACVKVLLAVGKGSEGKGSWARVGAVEIRGECFPPKVLQKRKDTQMLLRNLVRQGTTLMGMMPLEQPGGYQIEGHWASFGAAQGEPVTKSDIQSGEAQLIGVGAIAVQGWILGWVVETNDAAMFNQLLGSGVVFGTGTPQRLFGGGVQ
ncbi:MAG TPA: hypothetical protein VHE33_17175 [Acidobacteriaceae bacterium]|nr:hypothetical protein [Acidobacteriaceae bacterium]